MLRRSAFYLFKLILEKMWIIQVTRFRIYAVAWSIFNCNVFKHWWLMSSKFSPMYWTNHLPNKPVCFPTMHRRTIFNIFQCKLRFSKSGNIKLSMKKMRLSLNVSTSVKWSDMLQSGLLRITLMLESCGQHNTHWITLNRVSITINLRSIFVQVALLSSSDKN